MYSILIVDDEAIILEGLKEVIIDSALPFKEVRTASTAAEALRLYEKSPFDILLSDISMPQMNGLEMAEEMKKIWPYTEVIFLTGFQDFDYVRGALRLHSFDYLLKPMPDEELLGRLEAVIQTLDRRWMNRFVYDSGAAIQTEKKNREASEVLKKQLVLGRPDFSELKNSAFPFARDRRLRLILFAYRADKKRMETGALHEWITEILQKITYGYGYVCGFTPRSGISVFLVQKSAESEELFTGVYKALEEMQDYFYTRLDQKMTVIVSHRSMWERWIEIVKGMLEQISANGFALREYGALYTYEEEKKEDDSDGNLLMYRIRDYIAENPGADLSLGQLAQQFHMNPSYLSRCFHQTIQKPLSVYITGIRVEEAKRLLTDTDEKIYEIAQKVGFETQGYFTKVFNKMVGTTPKEYRTNNRDAEKSEEK